MKITFLGTGAADWDWSRYGEAGVCGSTATLIDDCLLVDCGPTVAAALERFGPGRARIEAIVVTHNHDDHFSLAALQKIVAGREGEVELFGPPSVCAVAAPFCRTQALDFGSRFVAAGHDVLALPANHAAADFFEKTFLYRVSGAGRSLLYALDTAWLPTIAYRLLGKERLDGVVWDATMSAPGDWRVFEHTDPAMFAMMRKALTANGNLDARTRVWFDHRARTLWPAAPEEQEAIARRENVELARDGETVFL